MAASGLWKKATKAHAQKQAVSPSVFQIHSLRQQDATAVKH